jgi:HlyD family secretion protein
MALRVMALCTALILVAACSSENNSTYQGWIEADLIFVSADEQGRIETMKVREGDQVKSGELLFTLDDDLQKADVGVAEATLTNAQQAFDRAQQLAKTGAGTQRDFDVASAALREARARLNSAQTRLARRRMVSPVAGAVQQVYFRPGETVQPGKSIVSLLPPANIKVRFFVPEAVLPRLAIGDKVKIECDGCARDLEGSISFISQSAEYTPPVIYSLDERAKLVFLVEARPNKPDALRVGQPVSVALIPHQVPQ